MAKRVKEPESEIVKVVDPLHDAPVEVEEVHETPPASPPTGPGFGERVRRFFDLFLRLISWVIIFTVFGAALYYGLPLLYQRFVAPVQQNTAQMLELQSRQEQTEQELAGLQSRLETIEAVQSQSVESSTQLDNRVSKLETEIDARTQSLAGLETVQAELQEQNEAASAELDRQINLMKAMELLSRARLFMYQSNFGLAKQDVQIAHDLLKEIRPDAQETLADELDAVIRRLELTLSNLPNFPVAASDDLDIAWQILLSGLPQDVPTSAGATLAPPTPLSATPEVNLTSTPPSTIEPTITP